MYCKHFANRPMLCDAVSCPFQSPWKPQLPKQSRRLIKHLGKTETSSFLFRLKQPICAIAFHFTTPPTPSQRASTVLPPAGALHSVAQVNSHVQHCPRASEPRRSVQEELMRDTLRTCCLLWHLPAPPPPSPACHTHTHTHSLNPHASLDAE